MDGPLDGYRIDRIVTLRELLSTAWPLTSGIPRGLVLGLWVFNIVSDMDSGTERTLSKFAYAIRLCGVVNMVEGWDAI